MRLIAPLVLLAAAPGLSAQETRTGEPGIASAPATVAEMGWLVGQWRGSGVQGWAATENWLPAIGNTIIGTFIQADEAGNIMFSEHMYLAEQDGSLVLRVKHFNPDFTGWEEKDEMLGFRLLALEHCRATFSGLTIRCDGENGLLIAVRMRQSDGSTGELVFGLRGSSLRRRRTPSPPAQTPPPHHWHPALAQLHAARRDTAFHQMPVAAKAPE